MVLNTDTMFIYASVESFMMPLVSIVKMDTLLKGINS